MPQTTTSAGRLAALRGATVSPPIGATLHGGMNIQMFGNPKAAQRLNGSHILSSQISVLVAQLSKKNYRQTSQELSLLSTHYGYTATVAVLKNLLTKIDLKSARDQPKMQLLLQALDMLSSRSNFVTLVCQAFEDIDPMPHDFLHKLSKALKLTIQQDLLLGVSLIHSPRMIAKSEGLKFLRSKLPELPTLLKEKLTEPVLHELLHALSNPNIDAKMREAGYKFLHQLYKSLGELIPHMLSLLVEDETTLEQQTQRATLSTRSVETSESNAVLKQIVASLGPAQVMQDLGYACCQEEASLKVLLRQFGRVIDEAKVARMLGMMAATHTGLAEGIPLTLYDATVGASTATATTWNLDVFIGAISSMCPKLDWLQVMHQLDFAEFVEHDLGGFELLASAYRKATSQPFPSHVLLSSKWRNINAQLSMIKFACQSSNAVSFASIAPLAKFNGLEDLLAKENVNPAITSVALVTTILSISEESGYYAPAAQLLEEGRSFTLLLALVESKANALLKDELVVKLTTELLQVDPADFAPKWTVIRRIWTLQQLTIVDTMINLYNKSPEQLLSILHVAQELELETILNLVPYTLFAMDLAVLASHSNLLDLNNWIKNMISEQSDMFVRSILQEFSSRLLEGSSSGGLSVDTMNALIASIRSNESLLSQEALTELADISKLIQGSGSSTTVHQSEEEVEADKYFQLIYDDRMSPAELVEKLKTLKTSPQEKDQRVFACMINSLFEEYAFFETYPDKELQTTALLFAYILQSTLLDSNVFTSALSGLLKALSGPSDSRMFGFGLSVISHVPIPLMLTWPNFVKSLLELALPLSTADALRKALEPAPKAVKNPVPVTTMAGGAKSTGSPARGTGTGGNQRNQSGGQGGSQQSSGGGQQSSGGSSSGGASGGSGAPPPPPGGNGGGDDGRDHGASLPLSTLVSTNREIEQPDDESRDRIHFILNNVSANNLQAKAADLKAVLKPDFFDYFANHIVVHRVSTDTRFQSLYLDLVDLQGHPELFQKLLKTTYRAIHTLLNSPKLSQAAERTLLKNLGTWLGALTIARNKPVMHIDLPLKELILKAYEQGTLYAVLPFVSRVLMPSVDSKVFRIPNPWIFAILRLLKEIHKHPRAQQNIKFEIELLYQAIQEDLASMPPSEQLLARKAYNGPNMRDFLPDTNATIATTNGAATPATPAAPATPAHAPGTINWMPPLLIQPDLNIFNLQPVLKQRLHAAFNKAIDDLFPDADNTVAIVPKTTLRLVLKDLANEPDENKVLTAARAMAQSLASSLLHATLRNHIRTATHQTMKASLEVKAQYDTIQPQFHRAIDDNLDVACSILAKHFVEKTLTAVEHDLRPHLESRIMHRDQLSRGLTTRPFSDQTQQSVHQGSLPEMLKVRTSSGASAQQLALYEGFMRLPSLIQASMEPAAEGPGKGGSGLGQKELLDAKKALERLDGLISDLERWASAVDVPIEAAPDATSAMAMLPRLTMTVLRETQDRVAVATQCALHVFDLLYTNPRSLSGPEPNNLRDMYVRILFALARATPAVVEVLTKRYIAVNSGEYSHSPNGAAMQPYHRELTISLLTWQLLRCDMLDVALSTEMKTSRPALDFALYLVKTAILGTHTADGAPRDTSQQQLGAIALLAGSDIPRVLAELEAVLSRNRSPDLAIIQSCAQIPLDSNTQSRRTATHTDQLQGQNPKRAQVGPQQRQHQLLVRQQLLAKTLPQPVVALFSEWVNLWQHGTPSLEVMTHILGALRQLGLCSFGDASLAESEGHFLRGVIDAAVLAYLMQSQMQMNAQASIQPGTEPTPDQATYLAIQPYAAIDALSKLIVFLVKNYSEPARILLLQRVLHQISAAASQDYLSNVSEFNQRPYFRLLSSLLSQLTDPVFGEKLESLFLSAFADLLLELRPQQCPGFAFAWLELVSHRLFMPKLIRHPRACFALQKLLIFHLTFMEPYLANAKLNEAVFSLYQGTLRVFLVLIHDFPEFLCDFHHSFCDVLPPTCIQLRNLILSAFPRNVKLPDPALNIKMEHLPAAKESPRVVFNLDAPLQEAGLLEHLKVYLTGTLPAQEATEFLSSLPQLVLHGDASGKYLLYNVKLINALVLYVGIYAIQEPHTKAPLELYMSLANALDAEGRYHLFNAFANQLRYPSSHTHFFSWALLWLFTEASSEAIPEQITRVLLERYIAQKPTPWGLAITYQELTKNQEYNFWGRDFVKASPDIGRLFMNLSRRSTSR